MYLKKTQQTRLRIQWRFLSNQLRKLTEQGKFQKLTADKRAHLIAKLKSLFQQMLRFEKASSLKKALGVAALLLGLQLSPIQAQVEFAPEVTNPFGLTHSGTIDFHTLADIDGDGDLDILSMAYQDNDYNLDKVFTFFENQSQNEGTEANFIAPVFNYLDFELPSTEGLDYVNPILCDIDDDGDLDLFIGAYYDDYQGVVFFSENTGDAQNPVFSNVQLNPFSIDLGMSGVAVIKLADIDNDGDFDLFSTFNYYDEESGVEEIQIDFLENIGSPENPDFALVQHAPFGLPTDFSEHRVYDIGDIDNDGDLDMITGGFVNFNNPYTGIPFTFFENTGDANNPQFAEGLSNPFSLEPQMSFILYPHLADLDNDGDLDILTDGGYEYDTGMATWIFHENLLDPVATKEPILIAQASVYPTVSDDFVRLTVETESVQAYFQINVFDVQAKLLAHKELAGGSILNEKIDLSTYPAGQYLIQVRTPEGMLIEKVIKQ